MIPTEPIGSIPRSPQLIEAMDKAGDPLAPELEPLYREAVRETLQEFEAEALPHIFKMFSQVKSSHDRSDGGLGIGLALAQGLARLHGGDIEARSEGLGMGSELVVRLPVGKTHVLCAAGDENKEAGSPSRKRRILIADDNEDAAQSLCILLRMEGHEVQIAHDGQMALEQFAAWRPEVAILDIGMPGLNGYEVARQMRAIGAGRDLLLVAVTGWGQQTDKALAFEAGFDHHFTKPLEPDRIFELLGR